MRMKAIYRFILFVTIACILFGVWTAAFQTYFPAFKFLNQFFDQYEDQIADENVSQSSGCAPETAWACTVKQLCDRATFGSPKRWHIWEAESGYVKYAKDQGLTCGVVERTASTTPERTSSSNQCSSNNVSACSSEQLCDRRSYVYADEARRRGLTCGGVERATTTTESNSSISHQCALKNVRACSTQILCERGTYGTPLRWYERISWSGYADEARRRGLTCGVVEQADLTTSANGSSTLKGD